MDTDAVSDAEMGEEGAEGMTPWRPQRAAARPAAHFDYHAFTTRL